MKKIDDQLKSIEQPEKVSYPGILSPAEYEAALQRIYARNYDGPCRPDCPDCGGRGVYRKDVPKFKNGSINPALGKLHTCPNIHPSKSPIHKQSGLVEIEFDKDWGAIALQDKGTRGAVIAAKDITEKGFGMAYIGGTHGNAKTTMLQTAVARTLALGKRASYVWLGALMEDIQSGISENQVQAKIDKWHNDFDLLAIDEMEKVSSSEWVQNIIIRLIDVRHSLALREEGATLMAGNVTADHFDSSVRDRLRRWPVFYLTAESRRRRD